jgi:hypothetical protein
MSLVQYFFVFGLALVCSACAVKDPGLPDSGESNDFKWGGAGCEVAGANLTGLIARTEQETAKCVTERFAVSPGHYIFEGRFRGSEFNLSQSRPLTEVFSVRLKIFNVDGQELPQPGRTKFSSFDASHLKNSLEGIARDEIVPTESSFRVTLIPRFYPFDSGWIPPEARSAQIEISLKGSAKIRVDNLVLQRSKWNLTLRERVQAIRDTNERPLLFPRPQHAELNPSPSGVSRASVCVRISDGSFASSSVVQEKVTQLALRLRRVGFDVHLSPSLCGQEDLPVVLSRAVAGDPPHNEGYAIDAAVDEGVFARAHTTRGLVYALSMVEQLFVKSDDSPGFYEGRIRDFPSTEFRAASGKDARDIGFVDEMNAAGWIQESRLNQIFLEAETHDLRWWAAEPRVLFAAQTLAERSQREELFELGVLINPYIHRADPSISKDIQYSSEAFDKEFYRSVERFLRSGARSIIVRADDFVPHRPDNLWSYVVENPKDQAAVGTLGRLHSKIVSDVWARVQKEYPHVRVFFVPPWYTRLFIERSEGAGEGYAAEVARGIPPEVTLMWTGPAVRSLSIDAIEARYFSSLYGGRTLFLWDNTLYARKHDDFWGKKGDRLHLNSSIEPFDVSIEDLPAASLNGMFINAQMTELFRVQLATAGAYLWNPARYQPEEALWSYLLYRFGEQGAELILKLDEEYWAMKADAFVERQDDVLTRRTNASQLIERIGEICPTAQKLAEEYHRRL